MQDFAYFKSLYPAIFKQMQLCVEAVCDEMEYEGSPIYDEYPDRIFLEKLTKRVLEKWQAMGTSGEEEAEIPPVHMKAADVGTMSTEAGTGMVENSPKMESFGGEKGGNLAGTSIQPHLPGNDVWYGPLRGEQQGGGGGYTVWEADEPNLTAQERRPWSPPPGPRPGGPGSPWGPLSPPPGPRPGGPGGPWGPPSPPPGPRPGGPGNPWGSPPPPPGPRPGDPGNPWGPPPPPPGLRPGKPGNPWGPPPPPPGPRPWGTPFQDFLQVLLMNELQERRRCRKC